MYCYYKIRAGSGWHSKRKRDGGMKGKIVAGCGIEKAYVGPSFLGLESVFLTVLSMLVNLEHFQPDLLIKKVLW